MKCSKCGHRATNIGNMAKHYRKAHPSAMKRKASTKTKSKKGSYCHACGKKK